MSEMIKRIALTLAALDGMPAEHFYAHDESFRIGYYRRARAAIEAMRGPTEEMKTVGTEVISAEGQTDRWTVADAWNAMCDKALE